MSALSAGCWLGLGGPAACNRAPSQPQKQARATSPWVRDGRARLDELERAVIGERTVPQFFRARIGTQTNGAEELAALGAAARQISSPALSEFVRWRQVTFEPRPPRPGESQLRQLRVDTAALPGIAARADAADVLAPAYRGPRTLDVNRASDELNAASMGLSTALDRVHAGALVRASGWDRELVTVVSLAEKQRHPTNMLSLLKMSKLRRRAWTLAAAVTHDPTVLVPADLASRLRAVARPHDTDVANAMEGELLHAIGFLRELLAHAAEVEPEAYRTELERLGPPGAAADLVGWLRHHPGQFSPPEALAGTPWARANAPWLERLAEDARAITAAQASLQP